MVAKLFAGVEPWYFYFINGFLNFNIAFILALMSLPLCVSVVVVSFEAHLLLWSIVFNKQ